MNEYNPDAPVLRQASRNRGLLAFLITSSAVFMLISLWWPLSMRGYRSEGLIEFENQEVASMLVTNELPNILRSVMNPTAMSLRLEQNRLTSKGDSRLLNSGNLDEIYRRISVGFRDATQTQKPGIRVVLSGSGATDEAKFIRTFTTDIAARLDYASNSARDSESNVAMNHHPIDQAHWLVNQIEEGLTSARAQTAQLMTHAHPNSGATFRAVGHVREISNPNIDSLHQTLESVDVASLRGVIQKFEENPKHGNAGLVRFDADSVANVPIGAVPSSASMILAGLLSIAIGGVVAWNIRPFAGQGFESVGDVTDRLGVPVIGTLRAEPSVEIEDEPNLYATWANRAVRISGTVLAAIAILGVGFWLTSAEVRDLFGESWFHGFARIFWKLSGS